MPGLGWHRYGVASLGRRQFASALILCLVCPTSAVPQASIVAGDGVIVIGGDHSFPPYEFLDENGEPAGFNVDLSRAIASVMGIEIQFAFGNWAEMRDALEASQIDILQGVVQSDDRSRQYAFSPPHSIISQSIFARSGEDSIESLEALAGKDVVVQQSGIMHDYLVENDIGANITVTDTHVDALRELAAGEHDYALVANLPGLYLGREFGLSNVVEIAKPLEGQLYGYAVLNGNEALLAQFSEGLAIVNNTGLYQELYDQWLGPLEDPGIRWEIVGQVTAVATAVLLLILGAILTWNRALHKEVESRTKELYLHQQKLIQADKMTSLGTLVSGVAHEINNPNGMVLLNLPIIRDVLSDSMEIFETYHSTYGDFDIGGLSYSRMRNEVPLLVTDMIDASVRIKRIVDDLQNFSRQGYTEDIEDIDLNERVKTALRMLDTSIAEATQHFSVEFDDDIPVIRGNAQRIEQVIINLVLNACQSLSSRDQRIRVSTSQNRRKRQVILVVSDEGVGIEEEYLSRLADPFFTTKRDSGGTGLGLFISTGIARDHDGTLEFESKLGLGTTATLTMPFSGQA